MSSPVPPPPSAPPPVVVGTDPSESVKGPAIALMIVAGLGGAYALFGILMAALGVGGEAMSMFGDADMPEFVEMMMSTGFRVISGLVVFIFNAFVFFCAMQMKQLHSWPLALAGSIVAMTPCVSLCCIIGLPIGIWALVVLFKPEVKEAFS